MALSLRKKETLRLNLMNWYTADNHWGHDKIIGYTGRPFGSVYEMNKTMIDRWNECVDKDDTVVHLGDFCFPEKLNIDLLLASLNGHIILVKGNHDKKKTMNALREHGHVIVETSVLELLIWPGIGRVVATHRPVYPAGTPDPFKDHNAKVDPDQFDLILSGHIHEKRLWTGKSLNIGVDQWNFYPVSQEEITKAYLKHGGLDGN